MFAHFKAKAIHPIRCKTVFLSNVIVRRTQQQLNAALYASDCSTGKNWKAAENLKLNQWSAHWIAGNSHGCFSHMQQSELCLCWLCDMPNAERKVSGRGITVLLLPYCTEWDHIEVQMNQVLQVLVLLLMQGWCTVVLVCLCLDAAQESFLPVCAHLLVIQLGPHQSPASSHCGPRQRVCRSHSQLEAVQQHHKGGWRHRNPGTVLGSTPVKGKSMPVDGWQDRELQKFHHLC